MACVQRRARASPAVAHTIAVKCLGQSSKPQATEYEERSTSYGVNNTAQYHMLHQQYITAVRVKDLPAPTQSTTSYHHQSSIVTSLSIMPMLKLETQKAAAIIKVRWIMACHESAMADRDHLSELQTRRQFRHPPPHHQEAQQDMSPTREPNCMKRCICIY